MDLIAYQIKDIDIINNFIKNNYGNIPRIRGVRLMKLEKAVDKKQNIDVLDVLGKKSNVDYKESNDIFNKYVGQDVIYIHTRCGDCGLGYSSKESNYKYYGADEWEKKYEELFLEHITDPFDNTYCTHYFKAVDNAEYQNMINELQQE